MPFQFGQDDPKNILIQIWLPIIEQKIPWSSTPVKIPNFFNIPHISLLILETSETQMLCQLCLTPENSELLKSKDGVTFIGVISGDNS
jgi:hypothetical protein